MFDVGGHSSWTSVSETYLSCVGDGFAAQKRPQADEVLAKVGHRGGDLDADLAHPVLDPVSDADADPAGEGAFQRRDLHRGDRDIAHRHGQHTDADGHPIAVGKRDRGRGDPAGRETVLPQPHLVETRGIGGTCGSTQSLGRVLGPEDTTHPGR